MKTLSDLTPKEKKWALLALLVAVVAVFYTAVVEPFVSGISVNGSKISAKKKALEKNLKVLARYEALKADYARSAKTVPASIGKENVTETLVDLERIAKSCAVSLVSIKPQILEEDGSTRVLFDVSIHADALGLSRFLYLLETSSHLLRVKRLTLTASSSEDLQGTLLVSQLTR